jgi:hypothetical protein
MPETDPDPEVDPQFAQHTDMPGELDVADEQPPPRFKLPRIDPSDAAVAKARANPRDAIGVGHSSFRWRPE